MLDLVLFAGAGLTAAHAPGPFDLVLAEPPVLVGPMAGRPTLADLDGDGDLDVAVTCGPCCGRDPHPEAGHLRLLLNDGTGRLSERQERILVGEDALGSAVGDLDGDGRPDVVVYRHGSYDAMIVPGLGGGEFGLPRAYPLHDGAGPHVHSLALHDVDADGTLDLLATLVGDHALAVHLGDGAGGFRPAHGQPYFAHRHPYRQLELADLDGDRNVDVVLTDVRGNGLTVLVGSGTGMFASSRFRMDAHTPVRGAERPVAASLGDLDGDHDLDAVVFIEEAPLALVFENRGGGEFRQLDATVPLRAPTIGGALADLDLDGRLDLIASSVGSSLVSVAFGEGGGRFAPCEAFDAGGEWPDVAVGDMDGDGQPDVVTGNFESGSVSVLLSR